MLPRQVRCLSAIRVTVNFAFRAGSSKHGNALRASVGSICVVAKYLVSPFESLNDDR